MANTVLLMWCVIMGVAFSSTTTTGVHGKKPPATFIFGDSLVDAGNNNYIFTLAAANHKPYGIDWPDQQATGRFLGLLLLFQYSLQTRREQTS